MPPAIAGVARDHQIRKRQDHHPDPQRYRSITHTLPAELIDRPATSENIKPSQISLSAFDRLYV
jgi:hypothetical protein